MNVPFRNTVFPKSSNTCLKMGVWDETNLKLLNFTEFVSSFKKLLLSQHSHHYWGQEAQLMKFMILALSLMSLAARLLTIKDTWISYGNLLSTSLSVPWPRLWLVVVPTLLSPPCLSPLPESGIVTPQVHLPCCSQHKCWDPSHVKRCLANHCWKAISENNLSGEVSKYLRLIQLSWLFCNDFTHFWIHKLILHIMFLWLLFYCTVNCTNHTVFCSSNLELHIIFVCFYE